MKDAIEIFKLNAAAYPEASNPYDCLDEAYMVKGDKAGICTSTWTII